MTDTTAGDGTTDPPGRATADLRTSHPRPGAVVAALAPDNTPQIDTCLADGRVVTTVRREDVAGLRATVQDYLRNLDAADRTVRAALSTLETTGDAAEEPTTALGEGEQHSEPDSDTNTNTNTDSPINEDTQTHDNE